MNSVAEGNFTFSILWFKAAHLGRFKLGKFIAVNSHIYTRMEFLNTLKKKWRWFYPSLEFYPAANT